MNSIIFLLLVLLLDIHVQLNSENEFKPEVIGALRRNPIKLSSADLAMPVGHEHPAVEGESVTEASSR